MQIKKIIVDDKEVIFGASARLPRLYRETFGRDVIKDMASLTESFRRVKEARKAEKLSDLTVEDQLSVLDLSIFENIAYAMNKLAVPSVPDIDEWLDQFGTFDVYEILPELLELWNTNQKGMSIPKKK